MQLDATLDLADARRGDSPEVIRDLTRATQVEALLVAYLLTADRAGAWGLARAAYRRLARDLKSLDPEADPRFELFARMARCFLLDDFESGYRTLSDAETGHDSQRHELLAELRRTAPRTRLALVFSSISGFDLRDLNLMLSHDDAAVTTPIETTTRRFRQRLGIPESVSIRSVLLEASLERPRDDLWPDVEAMLDAEQRLQQRRGRARALAAICSLAIVVMVTIAAVFAAELVNGYETTAVSGPPRVPVAADTLSAAHVEPIASGPIEPLLPTGNVPATLFIREQRFAPEGQDAATTFAVVDIYNQLLLDTGVALPGTDWQGIHISPDGGTLAVVHSDWTDDGTVKRVSALDSSTFGQRWQVEIGRFERSSTTGRDTARLSLAPGSQQIFVAVLNDEEMDIIRLHALDRVSGKRLDAVDIPIDTRRETGVPSTYQGEVYLRLAPDESRLFLTAVVWNTSFGGWREHHATTHSIGLDDAGSFGPATQVVHALGGERGFFWWDAWLSPRGNVLHGFATQDGRRIAGYQFLDLDRDRLTAIDLPFESHPEREYRQIARIQSNDGRRAYLIDTESRETVVINLVEQRLERHFTIDPGDFVSRFGAGRGQLTFGMGHALAHDGTRLYLTAQSADWARQGDAAHSTGIWMIDLHSWTIVDFIPVQGTVTDFHALPGSAGLVVSNWFYEHEGDERASTSLMRIPYHNGHHWWARTIQSSLPEQNIYRSLLSFQGIYRMQHGRTPNVDGVAPRDIDSYTTLPRFEVEFPEHVASGVGTSLEVRVLHPASGEVMRTTGGGVRFNPDSLVMARLRAEGQPGQIVVLANVEPGVYRGAVTLPADGKWSVDVLVAEAGVGLVVAAGAGLVDVNPTFAGSDGNLYRFRISTDPRSPVVDEEALVRLRIVNVETGERLPLDVDLNVELPPRIDVAIANPELITGYRTVLLYQASHNSYEATATFQVPGDWQATIRLRFPETASIETPGGTIEVLDGD